MLDLCYLGKNASYNFVQCTFELGELNEEVLDPHDRNIRSSQCLGKCLPGTFLFEKMPGWQEQRKHAKQI